jgi:tyrosyl-DNA phosphodiesterase 2
MQTFDAFRFDPSRGCWLPAKPGSQAPPDRLTLVTFNAWFGDYLLEERFAALLGVVRACRPDVVALQEVTPRHLEALLAQPWVRQGFWVSDATGASVRPHGVLLLSRLAVRGLALCLLPSGKARKLLVAELGGGPRALFVANLHLESSPSSTPLRLAQLDTVLPSLHGVRHAVLMGDFNFDPSQQPEQARVQAHYRDLWAELRPQEPGYTEDTDINRMRLRHKNQEKRVRFDRILLRSSSPGWEPEAIRLIGTRPIAPDRPEVFPSDHFGLAGRLVWRGNGEPGR